MSLATRQPGLPADIAAAMLLVVWLAGLLLGAARAEGSAVVHYDLELWLDHATGRIDVESHVRIARMPPDRVIRFALSQAFAVDSPVGREAGRRDEELGERPGLLWYRTRLPVGSNAFTVRYAGVPRDSEGPAVSAEGAYLGRAHGWYPVLGEELLTMRVTLHLPAGWRVVTQGRRLARQDTGRRARERWEESRPQEAIHVAAGSWHEFALTKGRVPVFAFLRSPDGELAGRYMETAQDYLALYETLIGPYPWDKFALVEHHQQTGYAMPSFTLLGSRVIRLPFILHTAYLHEILHNWWGAGVDDTEGNWSEGLTTYLADHLAREREGEGSEYRRLALQRYTDYTKSHGDVPLSAFRSRHDAPTQAVGYDKAMMVFHMLRRRMGDATFITGLRRFYQDHRHARAGYGDLRKAFEAAGAGELGGEFSQWLARAGAPKLQVSDARALPEGGGYRLRMQIEQGQREEAFALRVPLAIELEGEASARIHVVEMRERGFELDLWLAQRPWRVQVDPHVDVLRRLDPREVPPALSGVLARPKVLAVVPTGVPDSRLSTYDALVRALHRGAESEVRRDVEIDRLPGDRAVWLFGWDNRWWPAVAKALDGFPVTISGDGVVLENTRYRRDAHGVLLLARHPQDPSQIIAWLGQDDEAALASLSARLRHYGRYSYAVFHGAEAVNVARGRWPVVNSPMSVPVEQPDGSRPPSITVSPKPPPGLTDLIEGKP